MTEPIIVSYSELDTYRQCPLKHHVLYVKRYTKGVKPDSALDKGSRYHLVMETHYKLIKKWQDENNGKNPKCGSAAEEMLINSCKAAVHEILWNSKVGEYYDDVAELIWWMYEGHLKKWCIDHDWRILGVEHQIITPLRDERGRRTRFHLKAKMDLVVRIRSTGGIWVVDHKSGKDLPTQMSLEIDDQFGLYTWAMREVGKPVIGSIHNANRTQRNKGPMALDARMSRTYLNRGEKEITNLALDAYHVAWNAHPPKGNGPKPYSSPDPRQCGWKCDIKEPHLLMRTGRSMHAVLTEYGFKIDKTRH